MNALNTLSFRKSNRITFNLPAILRDFAMVALVLWLSCPYQAFFTNWYIYAFLWLFWLLFAFLSDSNSLKKMFKSKYTFFSFLWPCSIFLLSIFGWADFSIYQFSIVLLISSFIYYANGNHSFSLKVFLIVFFIYAIFIFINSVQQLRINPEISRILANSDKDVTESYAGLFMANFSFINNMTSISLLFFFCFLYFKKKIAKILFLCLTIACVFLIVLAQYSIALFLFLIFAIIMLVFLKRRNIEKKVLIFIFLILCSLFLLPFVSSILKNVADALPSGYIERRIRSIGELFGGSVNRSSDLADRLNLYQLSISTFFNHFFIGVGGAKYAAGGQVGGHSQILDNFAYYGIFFGAQFVLYLIFAYKNCSKFLKSNCKTAYRILFMVYILQCTLNTSYNEEMLFVIYFIVPSFIFLIQQHERKKAVSF